MRKACNHISLYFPVISIVQLVPVSGQLNCTQWRKLNAYDINNVYHHKSSLWPVCLSVHLSICLSALKLSNIRPSVCLSVFLFPVHMPHMSGSLSCDNLLFGSLGTIGGFKFVTFCKFVSPRNYEQNMKKMLAITHHFVHKHIWHTVFVYWIMQFHCYIVI